MIQTAAMSDTPRLIKLWEMCFPGEPGFKKLFFEKMYRPEHAIVAYEGGDIAAMLHAFPYTLAAPGCELSAYYIYGVGTDPAMRGRGLAAALLEEVHTRALEERRDLCMLIPQDEGLFRFYKKHGFDPWFFVDNEEYRVQEQKCDVPGRAAGYADIGALNSFYEAELNGMVYARRPFAHWEMLLDDFNAAGGGFQLWDRGYAAYVKAGETLEVRESFSVGDLKPELSLLACELGCTALRVTRPGKREKLGAARLLTCYAERAFDKSGAAYLNLMHN